MSIQENGGLDADEARVKWHKLLADPESITDCLGPTPKLARRVAVKTKDTLTIRDMTERAQAIRAKSKAVKDPKADDLEALGARLQRDGDMNLMSDVNMWGDAQALAQACTGGWAGRERQKQRQRQTEHDTQPKRLALQSLSQP